MSIVLNLVSPTRSWIMSDGLALDSATGKKISGSLQKYEMLHSRLCIGYTGTYEFAKHVVNNLRRLHPNIESATIESAALYSAKIIESSKGRITGNAQFLFTGISDNGILSTATLCNDLNVTLHIPTASECKSVILHNRAVGDFNQEIIRFSNTCSSEDEIIKKAMSSFIGKVSINDKSVNKTTFFKIICL